MKNLFTTSLIVALSLLIGYKSYNYISITTPPVNVSITGPTTANVGDLVEYRVTAQNLGWFASTPLWQWNVAEVNLSNTNAQPNYDNTGVFFAVAPSTTKYFVNCSGVVKYNYFGWQTLTPLGSYNVVVSINGSNPTPTPTPTPSPNPPVNVPDGRFKIANLTYQSFVKHIKTEKRIELAAALAQNCKDVADGINSGTLMTLPDVVNVRKEKNLAALAKLGIDVEVVKPWDKEVQQKIYDLYTSKQVSILKDYADVYSEIAVGLGYVK
jgi:hypothetical protein